MWPTNVNLRLLRAVDFVADVDVVDVVVGVVVFVVVVVAVNFVFVVLLIVTGHIIFSCGQ